jgi:hypothetical protein
MAIAAEYAIESYNIGGGVGLSVGPRYALVGSASHAATGPLEGNSYQVAGGFGPETLVVPIEGGPTLRLEFSNGGLIVSWSPAKTGYVLQRSDVLGGGWSTAADGSQNPVILPVGPTTRFFRLAKP